MTIVLVTAGIAAAFGLAFAGAAHRLHTRPGTTSPAKSAAIDLTDAGEVIRKQLAIMNGWAHTLEERWDVLDDADKRMAIGIIRRTSEEAVVRAGELAASPRMKLSA
jgi:hypothetical protein